MRGRLPESGGAKYGDARCEKGKPAEAAHQLTKDFEGLAQFEAAGLRSLEEAYFVCDRLAGLPRSPITVLFVVAQCKPVGILHVHVLLRAGVA